MVAFVSARLVSELRDPLYANGLALVLNSALSAALGFVFWFIAARRFHADALGIGAAVVSAATLAALIGKAGFDAALIRYAPSRDARGLALLLGRLLFATLALTAVAAGVVLLLATMGVPSLLDLREPLFAAGFVFLAVGTAGAWLLDAYYISEQRGTVVLLRNLAFNVVKLGVPLLLVFSWGGRAVPLAWGVGLVASLVVLIGLLPGTLRRHAPIGEPPERGAAGYAMRNFTINVSEFLPALVLPLIVLDRLGPEENARFFLAWTIATVAFLASKAIAQSAFAALVRDADARAAVVKGATLSAILLAPAALAFYFGAPVLLGLLGEHYVGAARLLQLLALSVPALVMTNLYLAYLKAREDGWELTLVPLAGLIGLMITTPLALAWGGIDGVGVAWLATQTLLGGYAAARLHAKLKRSNLVTTRTRLRRRPHEG